MTTYLVKMTPLEPYAFGTDMKAAYPNEAKTGKESYIIKSNLLPEQTTILGMLRCLVLQHEGVFHADMKYSDEEREKMSSLIGTRSFDFSYRRDKPQQFGIIRKISPVFVIKQSKKKKLLLYQKSISEHFKEGAMQFCGNGR